MNDNTSKTMSVAGSLLAGLNAQRLLLLSGSVLLLAAPLTLIQPAVHWLNDPQLAMLLRGMALIKLALAVLALVVVWWRLGQPLRPRLQAVGVAGVWALSLAAGLIWQLHWIVPASALFHGAMLSLLVAAWREMDVRAEQRAARQMRAAGTMPGGVIEAALRR